MCDRPWYFITTAHCPPRLKTPKTARRRETHIGAIVLLYLLAAIVFHALPVHTETSGRSKRDIRFVVTEDVGFVQMKAFAYGGKIPGRWLRRRHQRSTRLRNQAFCSGMPGQHPSVRPSVTACSPVSTAAPQRRARLLPSDLAASQDALPGVTVGEHAPANSAHYKDCRCLPLAYSDYKLLLERWCRRHIIKELIPSASPHELPLRELSFGSPRHLADKAGGGWGLRKTVRRHRQVQALTTLSATHHLRETGRMFNR